MDILLTIGAVLLLIAGAIYPLIAIYALVTRMNQKGAPPLTPMGLMVRLFLIATVPLFGILGGFAGLLDAVWESEVLRYLILATGVASVAGFVVLAMIGRAERDLSPSGEDDRP